MSKTVKIDITADSKGVDKAVAQTNKSLDKLAKQSITTKGGFNGLEAAAGGLKTGVMAAGLAIGAAAAIIGTVSTREFGKLEQNLGGAKAVFGDFSNYVSEQAQKSAAVMGTSANQYLQTANKMGSLFQGTGASVADSMQMTTQSIQRAADVASVMGISLDDALQSVAGMAKGNFTMMDNLGVAMTDANIQAWALEKGINADTQAMTTGQKVGLAYQMFMDRTAKYAGNFARESGTLEGSLAILKASLSNTAAILGQAFAPMIAGAAQFITNYLIPAIQTVIPYIIAFAQVVGQAFSYIGRLLGVGGGGSGIAAATGQVAVNMDKASSGAGGLSDGLKGANTQAKKLKSVLAGFDEMNTLSTPDGGGTAGVAGAGGGAGGIGGLGDMGAILGSGGFDLGLDKVQQYVDQIKGIFTGLWTWMSGLGDQFPGVVGSFIKVFDVVKGWFMLYYQILTKIWGDMWQALQNSWNTYGASISQGFVDFINGAAKIWGRLFTDILDPIVTPFLKGFSEIWDKHLKQAFQSVSDFVFAGIDAFLLLYNKAIIPFINYLIDKFGPTFVMIGNIVGGVFNSMLGFIGDVINGVFRILTGLINFIVGVFTGDWGRAWNGVVDVFKGIWTLMTAQVKFVINVIIDVINGFIAGINQIKVPDWVPGVGGKGFNIARIPKLSQGGVVMDDTLAVLHKSSREAVLPLDGNTGWLDDLASMLTERVGGGTPQQLIIKIGEETFIDMIVNGINDRTRMGGQNVVVV